METPSEDHNLSESLHNQWRSFRSSNQWDRARDILGELLTLYPDSGLTHYRMGFALYRLSEDKESEAHFKRAMALDPGLDLPIRGLAFLYYSMGRYREADDHCRKYLEKSPEDPEVWILMARLSLHYEDYRHAHTALDRAAALDPEDVRIISLRTEIAAEDDFIGKISSEQQLAGYGEVLRRDPENANAHFDIGWVHLHQTKNYREAESSFRQALALNPRDGRIQNALISTLRKRDPILKLLWLPYNLGWWVLDFFSSAWDKKWPIIFLIFTWQFFLVGGFLLFAAFLLFFWPMTKIYESLTIVEIHKKMGKIALYTGPMRHIHRLSFPVRALIFGGIFATFWGLIIWACQYEDWQQRLIALVTNLAVWGLMAAFAFGLFIWIRDEFRKKRRRKKNININ